MPPNADVYSAQGKTHLVCQDYARRGDSALGARVVFADGCSSSPDTDFGARLLVQSAEKYFAEGSTELTDLLGLKAITQAQIHAYRLGLHPDCLDATLGIGIIDGKGGGQAAIWGDGIVGALRRDGSAVYHVIRYLSGAPPYLNYLGRKGRAQAWLERFGGAYTITSYDSRTDWYGPTVSAGVNTDLSAHMFFYAKEEYTAFVLLSDGAETFAGEGPVSLDRVMPYVMDMTNFNGEFVKRNIRNYLLGRVAKRNGWVHEDDLTVCAVYLGEL